MNASASLSIGDFSRATHVSAKMLRHYHQIGLLEPADVDAHTGYRRYTVEQIPVAQIIRRFRALDMPLDRIQAVLAAPDLAARNQLISEHLDALQGELVQTQTAVASLRNLLEAPPASREKEISLRRVEETRSAAITQTISVGDASVWYHGAIGELYGTLSAQGMAGAGPAGGIYSTELFAYERGEATVFVPYIGELRSMGRVESTVIPAIELATIVHSGPDKEIDRAYGTLAAYVARHAVALDGPIREYYLVGSHDTQDAQAWRTEVGWPVFGTGVAGG
jgi:DNA-binding transcriptional MerR regulator